MTHLKTFLRKYLLEKRKHSKRDYKNLTRTNRESEYQQDESAKVLLAMQDITDKIQLGPCPDCGGHLTFVDKNMGGGIRCFGKDCGEAAYLYENGCGFHAALIDVNPIRVVRIK